MKGARWQVFDADDEVVRRGQSEWNKRTSYYRTTMRYTITNAKDEPVEVKLTQNGLGRYWWAYDYRVVSEDIEGEQKNYEFRVYTILVPAEGERVVRVTYETRW